MKLVQEGCRQKGRAGKSVANEGVEKNTPPHKLPKSLLCLEGLKKFAKDVFAFGKFWMEGRAAHLLGEVAGLRSSR